MRPTVASSAPSGHKLHKFRGKSSTENPFPHHRYDLASIFPKQIFLFFDKWILTVTGLWLIIHGFAQDIFGEFVAEK